MKFRVLLWCHDCCGEDVYGCFDGGTEYALGPDLEPLEFATREEAEAHGAKVTSGPPWGFEVVEA